MIYFDWSKYKRVFAFGCSFTNYVYPTWADIIFNEIDGECYNYGLSGAGNLLITTRIAEANTRFNFCETDLILVMYTTAFREDRWIDGTWVAHGNIFNQGYYDKDFVKNYVDPTGCLIRDLALIEMSSRYIKSLPCDNLILKASPLEQECTYMLEDDIYNKVFELYRTVWDSMPTSLQETIFPNGWEVRSESIYEGKVFRDMHPITSDYYEYLKRLDINLTDKAKIYVDRSDEFIHNTKLRHDYENVFSELVNRNNINVF